MTSWTSEQLEAINKDGTNIIVSAGAGSGKTAVLTERVIRKLRDGVDINYLLVLTFTNAAAAEMKDRIRKAIKEEGMIDQLDYIDSAYITTFDSYAQSIVKKYHYLLNISSSIKIVDDTVLEIEKKHIIDELFENSYGDNNFNKLISDFCEKDDTMIKNAILSINDKLDLKPNKIEFIDNYIDNYYNEKYIDNLLKEYENLIIDKVNDIKNTLYNIEIYADGNFYSSLYDLLYNLISSNNYNEIKESLLIGKYPTLRGADDELKNYYAELKKQISLLSDLCHYSLDELKENLLSTKTYVKVILDLIKNLDKKINEFKDSNETYSFNDIAKMAISVVRNNKEVQNELMNYYNEIMVDEYQDTSDLQEEFISLISNHNVYMVGDIKQSIYRFRNANPEIFRTKYNNYSKNIDGYKIDLLKNFRSRDEVLNNINYIFDSVMDEKIGNAEYQVSHRMIFGNHMYDSKIETQKYDLDILNYKKDEDFKNYTAEEIEAFIIGNDIKKKVEDHFQVIDKETKKLRDFNYGDACIIMDRGSAFETYSKIFEYLSIPIVIWKDETLSGEDDIAIIKNIIGLIIKIKNKKIDQEFKYYFTSVARSYLFSYSDNEIFKCIKNNEFKNNELYLLASSISERIDEVTNVELLNLIIKKFNIYEKTILIGNTEKSIIRLNNLNNLFSSLSELGYTPYDLVDYFKDSSNSEIRYSLNTKVSGSVNLMNIHKSKGLEFSICYFSGFAKKFNDSDLKDSFIFDNKYGIITPFYKEGIGNTILKDLFRNKYLLDDISERIRLFYVAVTRAKEKMIIVASLDDKEVEIHNKVDDNIRMKYNSFLSIMNSIKKKMNKYIENVDLKNIGLTKEYDLMTSYNYKDNIDKINDKIKYVPIEIEINEKKDSHFSKVSHKLHTKEEISSMDFGTHMHYLLQITDFNNPSSLSSYSKHIINFINKLDLKDAKVYKEYEFLYNDENEIKHGIIDLMLEYNDHIDIIDYKLKNTSDDNYEKQVLGYKKYIENKTKKNVRTYLYSIINEEFTEIK